MTSCTEYDILVLRLLSYRNQSKKNLSKKSHDMLEIWSKKVLDSDLVVSGKCHREE